MDTKQAYNLWASHYDSNDNKTRDLEADALRTSLAGIHFKTCLEIGCGTGKNTLWFQERAEYITAIDQSEGMMDKAKEKISSSRVLFKQADITKEWQFQDGLYDLVSFSLVLEHIDNLDHIFQQVSKSLHPGGYVYIGELHPFKQYAGSKARFDTAAGTEVLECFNHHISDFIQSARKFGLIVEDLNEYFDDNDRNGIPRILTIILKKV
ncbi:class I SAM-dependent methyltransferase [Chitinophaga pinensis]|uniref:Methyltransferase type 11 n=1 Tax=Chitinophaga pinensis (strain ATCC 43595 / DSM 2588 / LMG 13176 / NBRC 15968 / NCIMB 11800 / UQM 2034) TaxID=485918 RepID=A0A979FZ01_CHIPD|nr:class I SAM-dependent methyltransferase [Chitinophaga pinensis]ACU57721.1 Methyltransferase type 11 [Chitinophaga pinensis DSM 2588]